MRRRISLLLAAMLAGTTLMLFGPAQPASAVVVCVMGSGTMTVAPGLLYPVLLGLGAAPGKDPTVDILIGEPTVFHSFVISGAGGSACVHVRVLPTVGAVTASGTLFGYCGHATGVGTIVGQQFAFVSVGTFLLHTGHVIGPATAVPTPLTGSCGHVATGAPLPPTTTFALPGGATDFIVTGAVVGLNCTNTLPVTWTLIPLVDSDTLVTQALHVHVHMGAHFYTRPICINPAPL